MTQTVCLDDTTVKFEIWDTAGQERYHSLAPMYYRGAQVRFSTYFTRKSAVVLVHRSCPFVEVVVVVIYYVSLIQAAIVVYDITKSDTFGRAKEWVKELQRQASPNIVIALAGNKADLAGAYDY